MKENQPPSTDLVAQVATEDEAVLATYLSQAMGDPFMGFRVSRPDDRTVIVGLTAPHLAYPPAYAAVVYAALTHLSLTNLTELKVVDGTDPSRSQAWQRTFRFPGGETIPAHLEKRPKALPLPTPRPAAIVTVESVPGPSQGSSGPGWQTIPPDPGGSISLYRARRSRHPWGLALISVLSTLGFGLGAGITQWSYSQQRLTGGGNPLTAPSLLPAFTPQRLATLRPSHLQAPSRLTLNAVGDIIPGTDYLGYRLPQDWRYLFRSIQHQLADADLTFGNFESTLTTVPHSTKDPRRPMTFAFRTPPWYASVLKEAGFDVLNVANNHSFDFGEQGFAETIAHIETTGMKAIGRRGSIAFMPVGNTTVAFIGFSHLGQHNRVQDLEAAAALVQQAKAKADIVVVSFHAGKEGASATYTRDETEFFLSENRGNVVQFSHTVINHGADLVLGHGPHVPRALELYQGKLIAYSLGNFLGYRSLSTQGPLGVSLILTAHLNGQGDFLRGRIIPVALDPNGVPYLDDDFRAVVLVRQYTRRDFPQTPLQIDDLGYLWPTD